MVHTSDTFLDCIQEGLSYAVGVHLLRVQRPLCYVVLASSGRIGLDRLHFISIAILCDIGVNEIVFGDGAPQMRRVQTSCTME